LPPIINGDHSKITLNTKNVFIECTATDLNKAEITLNTMLTMFSEYCHQQFEVEAVRVIQFDGQITTFPHLDNRTESIDANETNRLIGIDIESERMANLLTKMGLSASVDGENKNSINVVIPPWRTDVLHACDIREDVAIAYGFNNITKTIPKTNCFSEEVNFC
jgi:phenylalanyl-tRNA synthetase beta chain